jgi:hypothetical protein
MMVDQSDSGRQVQRTGCELVQSTEVELIAPPSVGVDGSSCYSLGLVALLNPELAISQFTLPGPPCHPRREEAVDFAIGDQTLK